VRIIARNTLLGYYDRHPLTRASLVHWYEVTAGARWTSTIEVASAFSKAKVVNRERVRFEIAGGDHRLIAAFHFPAQIAWVKFIGTHAEYDKVNAATVDLY